ncbi:putative nucleic acid-binding protein [Arabidopsis thaliana]
MALNAASPFTSLNAIKPFKTTWRIQVKIVHTWKQYTQYSCETVEMILGDTYGTLIHATLKKAQAIKFQRDIVARQWIVIENFTMSKAMGKFRATKHPYRMSLMYNSVVNPCASVCDDIYLDLADFNDVINEDGLNENILVVVNIGELITHDVNNKTTKKLEFELRDTRDVRLACTLWGRFAETLIAACENIGTKRVICLLRFAKIDEFKGHRSVSSAFDMSLLEIDLDHPQL